MRKKEIKKSICETLHDRAGGVVRDVFAKVKGDRVSITKTRRTRETSQQKVLRFLVVRHSVDRTKSILHN